MGQATRTTKLVLDLGKRTQGGANTSKHAYLEATVEVLSAARAFYVAFFLAHAEKVTERVPYFSEQHQEMRERLISADKLLTWAEFQTVQTKEHPHPVPEWNFSQAFADMPVVYRRAVMKDAIGKVKSYLSHLSTWQQSGKRKGKPGAPGASNHPTLYEGTLALEVSETDAQQRFVRLKVYSGEQWMWANYPVNYSRYFEQRRQDPQWEQQSPKLVLRPQSAELHFCQTKTIKVPKVAISKQNPDLVTVAVDLNVKNLAVITVRQHGRIVESVFIKDKGLDQQRYRHLKQISKKQWLSGKPVKGERNCARLWQHVRRMNRDAAHKTARAIARVCAKYPGCVLLFERLRKIKARGEANRTDSTVSKPINCAGRSIRFLAKKRLRKQPSPLRSIRGEHRSTAPAAARKARGSRFEPDRGSERVGASSSDVPSAAMKLRLTSMPVSISIIASMGSSAGTKNPSPPKVVDTRPERLQVAWEKSIGGQSR